LVTFSRVFFAKKAKKLGTYRPLFSRISVIFDEIIDFQINKHAPPTKISEPATFAYLLTEISTVGHLLSDYFGKSLKNTTQKRGAYPPKFWTVFPKMYQNHQKWHLSC